MNPPIGNQLNDKELVAIILNGNTPAFGIIVKNTENLVAQIVFKMIPMAEDRKDIVQDIYLKAFHHLASFQFNAKLSTWVAQIAYNTCFNYLRKKKPLLLNDLFTEPDDSFEVELTNFGMSTTDNPESAAFRKELKQILTTEIEKLPPVYKTLITLFHNEELSYDEISHITRLPAGTVKSYLYRARKTLKDKLLLNYKKEAL